jgi:hypothetical protein
MKHKQLNPFCSLHRTPDERDRELTTIAQRALEKKL